MSEYKRGILKLVGICVLGIVCSIYALANSVRGNIGPCTVYECDVPLASLSTKIHISVDNTEYCTVSGNIFWFAEDPLTMWDLEEKKMAHAGDDYHFIAQDSHAITVDEKVTAEMVGLIEMFGEKYDIYNPEGVQIAHADFNAWDTIGEIYDMDGKLIADYKSGLYGVDFEVRISDDCKIDDKTILMIFCSYYSDKQADS